MMVRVEVVYLFALKKILGKIKSGWSYVRLQTSFAGIPKVWFPSTSVLWFQVTQISILSWSLFKSIFLTLGVWQPQALLFWIANGLSLSRAHLYPSRDSPASVWSIPYLLSLPGRQSPPPPVLETRPHFPSLLCSCRAGTWHSSANQMQPPRTSSLKQVIQRSRNGMYLTKLAAAARRIFRGSGASGPVAPLSFLVSPCGNTENLNDLSEKAEIWAQVNWTHEKGNGNPFQYSCLENSMDRGVWWAKVHGLTKSQTWLTNTLTFLTGSSTWQPLVLPF